MALSKLHGLIAERKARVVVMGQGYVGLPLALCVAKSGFETCGYDVDPHKITQLRQGKSYITDVSDAEVAECLETGNFLPTLDPSVLAEADVVAVCVPTPLSKSKDPDMSYIHDAVSKIKEYAHPGMLLILESTTYPGTTDEICDQLSSPTFIHGKDFFACFSPERVDPGNPIFQTQNTPKVIGGTTDEGSQLGEAFYSHIMSEVVPVSSARVAEMVKLLENTFRAVNIGLVNELALMSERMNIDIWEVIRAASTKPFGFMPFYPGPGIGGHCIPLDPHYLAWKARSFDFHNKFIELASDINGNMPRHVVQRAAEALNDVSKSIRGSRVLILGIAYKKNIADYRESPGLEVMRLIDRAGADVMYHDPFVPAFDDMSKPYSSVELTDSLLKSIDLVIITTNHDGVDYERVAKSAPRILDTRNVLSTFAGDHIQRLGYRRSDSDEPEAPAMAVVEFPAVQVGS